MDRKMKEEKKGGKRNEKRKHERVKAQKLKEIAKEKSEK